MSDGIPSPNPDFPQPIKNVTGSANVKIQNKNLFDKDNATTVVGYFSANGSINYGGSSTITTSYSEIKPNTDMIVSGCPIEAICFYDKNKNFIERSFISANVSFNKNAYFIRLQAPTNTFDINKLQLELGTTATSYIPHQEQNLPFTFEEGQFLADDEKLQDEGMLKKWAKTILNGTEYWVKRSGANHTFQVGLSMVKGLCTHYSNFYSQYIDVKTGIYTLSTNVVIITDLRFTDVEDFKAWLVEQYENNTPVILEYERSSSNIVPYNSTQQAQYEAIKNARSYADKTIISSESDELGFDMNVVAVADANKVIDSLDTRLLALESEV